MTPEQRELLKQTRTIQTIKWCSDIAERYSQGPYSHLFIYLTLFHLSMLPLGIALIYDGCKELASRYTQENKP